MKEVEIRKQYIRVREKELNETQQKLQQEFETMSQREREGWSRQTEEIQRNVEQEASDVLLPEVHFDKHHFRE